MPPIKESDVLRQVRQYLRLKGFFVIRVQQGMGAHKGVSDLIAIRDGQVWFIETKGPTGQLSPYQEQFRDDLSKQGGTYLVVRSAEDIIAAVKGAES